jgi:hypothetical protein
MTTPYLGRVAASAYTVNLCILTLPRPFSPWILSHR